VVTGYTLTSVAAGHIYTLSIHTATCILAFVHVCNNNERLSHDVASTVVLQVTLSFMMMMMMQVYSYGASQNSILCIVISKN